MPERKMMKRREPVDYTVFIYTLKLNDKNQDGMVNEEEFSQILKDNKIILSDEVKQIIFNGVRAEDENEISYNAVRAVFETIEFESTEKSKNYSRILFRGIDSDRDGKINKDEYLHLAKINNNELLDSEIKLDFDNAADGENYVTYQQAMKHIFGIRVLSYEDPYSDEIIYKSPHSTCCLLI